VQTPALSFCLLLRYKNTMKQFNLIIKLLAIGLILYVFMQQKGGYMAEIKGQKTEDGKQKTESVNP